MLCNCYVSVGEYVRPPSDDFFKVVFPDETQLVVVTLWQGRGQLFDPECIGPYAPQWLAVHVLHSNLNSWYVVDAVRSDIHLNWPCNSSFSWFNERHRPAKAVVDFGSLYSANAARSTVRSVRRYHLELCMAVITIL